MKQMERVSATLYEIEQSILGLCEILEDPEATQEERDIAGREMQRWAKAEVGKVDRIHAFLRTCEMYQAAAKDEADRQRARASIWQERSSRLKAWCVEALQAAGKKRVDGLHGSLRVQANGGKQALKITNEDLIPDDYRIVSATFTLAQWNMLLSSCPNISWIEGVIVSVNQDAIRSALEAQCSTCHGSGDIPITDTHRYVCMHCDGTGHKLVPGAELEPRGSHLRVE